MEIKLPDDNTKLCSGHRDRLRDKFLSDHLADYEKLELLLSYAIPRRDVRPLARGLVKEFGGVYQVLTAPIENLMAFKGIGRNTAVFIKVVHQMMQIGYMGKLKETPVFHDEKVLHNYCRSVLAGKSVEEMHVLYLDTNLKLIADDTHTTGTVNESGVYPREIARRALQLNARSVIMMHNHPTSINSFSRDDLDVTARVQSVLKNLEIELYDHLLVVNGSVHSMRAEHYL
ncbi:MAG: RadC family protein [Alphaproteobacteria bacterium]|nr:RadC family protein [Alphaproteobacteria bacterium]